MRPHNNTQTGQQTRRVLNYDATMPISPWSMGMWPEDAGNTSTCMHDNPTADTCCSHEKRQQGPTRWAPAGLELPSSPVAFEVCYWLGPGRTRHASSSQRELAMVHVDVHNSDWMLGTIPLPELHPRRSGFCRRDKEFLVVRMRRGCIGSSPRHCMCITRDYSPSGLLLFLFFLSRAALFRPK